MTLSRFLSLYFFAFFLVVAFSVYAEHPRPVSEVILLYGTSCSGKSTLANKLQQSLKQSWSILDWDNYAEEFGDDLASELLINDLMQYLINNKRIIIDTQPCLELENTLINYNVKTILVYAPLKTLISRDDARNTLLKRPEKRRQYARAYIYETFFQLYGRDSTNVVVDEINPSDIQPDLIHYPLNEAIYNFFQQIVQSSSVVPIYTTREYDLIINTQLSDVNSAVRQIQSNWFVFD
jgi:shikimate kinase